VGYAGGSTSNPTYRDIGDHAETVQIDFDPDLITYEDLLEVFGKKHDPTRRSWSRQYASLILFHSDEQRRAAEAWKVREEHGRGKSLATEIIPYRGFTIAEDYHQKHSLRLFSEVFETLRSYYPTMGEMLRSTAVTRINGYIAGEGSCDALEREVGSFGLTVSQQEMLRGRICGPTNPSGTTCPLPGR